jgi:formylglycine-generating enzyme required for sulfatase activity
MMHIRLGLLLAVAAVAQSPSTLKNSIGMEFVKIPAGEFTMGCLETDLDCIEDEVPRHKVRLTKGFEMGKYEVTQAQWEAVMGKAANQSENKGANLPVDMVIKDEIVQFFAKLSETDKQFNYRLPTEAEWEYAARANAPEPAREKLGDFAWYNKNSDDESHPVGQKKANAWGLFDVLGNVRELVSDQAAYYDPVDEVTIDPKGRQGRGGGGGAGKGKGGGRAERGYDAQGRLLINGAPQPVFRGGAWDNPAHYVRLSARYYYYDNGLRLSDIGFRAVREPK